MKRNPSLWLVIFIGLTGILAQDGYYIHPPPNDLHASTVIAQYGEEIVTLGDFWSRVRFERWLFWRSLAQLVAMEGEFVLQWDDPQNPHRETVYTIVNHLQQEDEFADWVWLRLIREAFIRHSANERGFNLDDCDWLAAWSELIAWSTAGGCQDSEEFAAARSHFSEEATFYSGITETALADSIRAQIWFAELRDAVRLELPAISEVPVVRARQIRTEHEADMAAALAALQAGKAFTTVMLQFGADEGTYGNSGELGFITRGILPAELDQALFAAELDSWIGPIETDLGHHIAQAMEAAPQLKLRHIQVASYEEAEALRLELLAGADFAELARVHSTDPLTSSRGGEIGYLTRSQLLPELEEAIFAASVGERIGPLASRFGHHIFEITAERPRNILAQLRLLLVESTQLAEQLRQDLREGADFTQLVREHTLLTETIRSGGSIGYLRPDTERFPEEIIQAIFVSETGDILGPFAYEGASLLMQVTDLRDEAFALRARHITARSHEEAAAILTRLLAGEEFTPLAREHSLDPSARGQDGDTLAHFTQGAKSGSILPGELPLAVEEVIFSAEPGDLVGPIETEWGHFIFRIEERSTRFLNPLEVDEMLDLQVRRWFQEEPIHQLDDRSDLWQAYIPLQPLPSDVSSILAELDPYFLEPGAPQ